MVARYGGLMQCFVEPAWRAGCRAEQGNSSESRHKLVETDVGDADFFFEAHLLARDASLGDVVDFCQHSQGKFHFYQAAEVNLFVVQLGPGGLEAAGEAVEAGVGVVAQGLPVVGREVEGTRGRAAAHQQGDGDFVQLPEVFHLLYQLAFLELFLGFLLAQAAYLGFLSGQPGLHQVALEPCLPAAGEDVVGSPQDDEHEDHGGQAVDLQQAVRQLAFAFFDLLLLLAVFADGVHLVQQLGPLVGIERVAVAHMFAQKVVRFLRVATVVEGLGHVAVGFRLAAQGEHFGYRAEIVEGRIMMGQVEADALVQCAVIALTARTDGNGLPDVGQGGVRLFHIKMYDGHFGQQFGLVRGRGGADKTPGPVEFVHRSRKFLPGLEVAVADEADAYQHQAVLLFQCQRKGVVQQGRFPFGEVVEAAEIGLGDVQFHAQAGTGTGGQVLAALLVALLCPQQEVVLMQLPSLEKIEEARVERIVGGDGLVESLLEEAVGQLDGIVQGDAVPKVFWEVVVAMGARAKPRGKQKE